MFSRIAKWLGLAGEQSLSLDDELAVVPSFSHEAIAHLLFEREGLPQVDWDMAESWIYAELRQRIDVTRDGVQRGIAAAWLDAMAEALPTASRRWRSTRVEGIGPRDGSASERVEKTAERSLHVIGKAMKEVRGDPAANPIPAIAVVTLATVESYYDFISHFYDDEGAYATSGGLYVNQSDAAFPLLVVNAQTTHELEATIAHELTHHALKPDRRNRATCQGLPIWAEEGLTQMMEEHVTRASHFAFSREMLERHRELWEEIGFDGFAEGATFQSPIGEEQELSYHLAEALTRSLLTKRPQDFWRFARACRNEGVAPEEAEHQYLGDSVQNLAEELLHP